VVEEEKYAVEEGENARLGRGEVRGWGEEKCAVEDKCAVEERRSARLRRGEVRG